MNEIRDRARQMLPTVVLTLLSIVQAVAFEVLWTRARDAPHLWEGGLSAWIGWIQVVAVFEGLVVVWLFYTSIVMRFRWVPTTRDSVIPFVMGALELLLAELLAPVWLPYWFYVMAAIFAYSSWVSSMMLRAAASDEGDGVIVRPSPQQISRDYGASALFVGVLLVLGALVHVQGPHGVVALCCVSVASLLLLGQAALIRMHWNRSIALDPDESSDAASES